MLSDFSFEFNYKLWIINFIELWIEKYVDFLIV